MAENNVKFILVTPNDYSSDNTSQILKETKGTHLILTSWEKFPEQISKIFKDMAISS
jgi:hypothetical protein